MKTLGSLNYETPRQAGVKSIEFIGHGQYLLTFNDEKKDVWIGHLFPSYCGYGIKYKDLILEFCRSL